jgi:hypothetical protein
VPALKIKRTMKTAASAAIPRDFYDVLVDRPRLLRGCAVLGVLLVLLGLAIWNSGFLIKHHGAMIVVLSWILLPAILFCLPRGIRVLIKGPQTLPALRFGNQGIWSRQWSYLGWIKWSDIAAVVVVRGSFGKTEFLELRLDLHEEKYAQLTWNDQVSRLAGRLLGRLLGVRTGPRTLPLTRTVTLRGPWDELMAALDPVVAAHGVQKREDSWKEDRSWRGPAFS